MLFSPVPLGSTLEEEVLRHDRKECLKYGPCGVGERALYLGGRFLDRRFYLPWKDIRRVFKRVAMSKNGFSGKGVFGSLPFLVVVYRNGTERECPFKVESDVDRLLARIEERHPDIPTCSAAARQKLADAEAAEEARYLKEFTPKVSALLAKLENDRAFLMQRPALGDMLTAAAKQKRIVDRMPPAYRIGGGIAGILSVLAVLYGLTGLLRQSPAAYYFIIGGAAVFFMALSANALPGKWNSPAHALADWQDAVREMQAYLSERPDFPVPPQYAHTIVLDRMIRVIREGRADSESGALETVKADLKALNSSVTVSQKEHDEVAAVKPLFLVCDYRDKI